MTAEFIVAVHSLVFLNHKKEICTSDDIAQNVCTNPATVRKVMQKLKKAGLISAKSSFTGGYLFEADAKNVTLEDVFSVTAKHAVKVTWRSGNNCAKCEISRKMESVEDEIFLKLDNCCKEILRGITIDSIDKNIFSKGE